MFLLIQILFTKCLFLTFLLPSMLLLGPFLRSLWSILSLTEDLFSFKLRHFPMCSSVYTMCHLFPFSLLKFVLMCL